MKRYVIWILFAFPLVLIIPYLIPDLINMTMYTVPSVITAKSQLLLTSPVRDWTSYYKLTIFFLTLVNIFVALLFTKIIKEKDVRFFLSMFGLSMLFYLLNTIFDVISLYGKYPWDLYANLSDFLGNLPILFFLTYRVIADIRLIKRESRNIFIFGSVVASLGFVIVALVSTRLALSQGVPKADFFLYLPYLIETIAIMVLSITLYILYMELTFRYYILALITGYFFLFIGDTYDLFSALFDNRNFRGIERMFNLLAFGYFISILIWVRGKQFVVASIADIDKERQKYKSLFLELDDKVRDLLILTQLMRHDLGNDIVVISNALELFEEKKSDELLKMARKRLSTMEERILQLRSSSQIYASLRTEEIPITFVNDVTKLFDDVSLRIKDKNVSVMGNQLINFILFNLLENAFKHGGEGINVSVDVEKVKDFAVIKVIDDGIGMTEEEKRAVISHVLTFSESEGLPKGIGLSLAKTTVEGLGGRFRIEDNEPKGTIVIMELPIFN